MSKNNLLVKKVNIAKFDDYVTYEWFHSESYNLFERFLIRKILKNISPEAELAVDIGCGPGLVLREMCQIYEYCVGVDISLGILRCAKSCLRIEGKPNIDLVCADVECMPFKNSAFNVATMYSVLHHLPNVKGSLKETNRIMISNSSLILFHEPNEMHIRRISEKTLDKILGKVRAVLRLSVYKRKWHRFKQEVQLRFTKLGESEKLADIYSKKGFSIVEMRILMKESGFEVIQIKTRIQSFMSIFSRLVWPYKSIAAFDFVLGKIPVLSSHLPLLLCIAKKKEV